MVVMGPEPRVYKGTNLDGIQMASRLADVILSFKYDVSLHVNHIEKRECDWLWSRQGQINNRKAAFSSRSVRRGFSFPSNNDSLRTTAALMARMQLDRARKKKTQTNWRNLAPIQKNHRSFCRVVKGLKSLQTKRTLTQAKVSASYK